jgi:anthranilate synthase
VRARVCSRRTWAIRFVEEHEETPRCWYGGAVGMMGFDGHLNTGLTLRTVRIANGVAEVRAGATLLFDSDPAAEERETELKASAMRDAVLSASVAAAAAASPASAAASKASSHIGRSPASSAALSPRVLLVDHQDSFVHTLANYMRQSGAIVTTMRSGFDEAVLDTLQPQLLLLSPGPGSPKDFDLSRTIGIGLRRRIPMCGVCLGLQGLVEYYGGELGVLPYPMHGKPSTVTVHEPRGALFDGLPDTFQVGRYHSLYSMQGKHPKELLVTATTADGIIMAIQHATLPIAAVQFHPESIITPREIGLQMLTNAVGKLRYPAA